MKTKKAFTLVEMLVVIGIIALLMSVIMVSYSTMTKRAKAARAQELVDNTFTALNKLLSDKGGTWPKLVIQEGGSGNGRLRESMTKLLLNNGLMSIEAGGGQLRGTDRFGLVDPWAAQAIKGGATSSSFRVPSGGTIDDHILYFAVDVDGDGITEVRLPGGSLRVRANVCVWSVGPNGVLDDYKLRGRSDDMYSWSVNQVVD